MQPSEHQFRALVEHSPEAIFVGAHGGFAYVNPAFARLMGAAAAEQLLGQPILARVHPDHHAVVSARIRRLREERAPVPPCEEVYLRLDGSPVEVEVSAVPFRFGDEDGALVFVRDIGRRCAANAR